MKLNTVVITQFPKNKFTICRWTRADDPQASIERPRKERARRYAAPSRPLSGCYGWNESACASPTMISAPCGRPKAFGLSTIKWIARTLMPLLVEPEHGGAPPSSQVCSFRVTEPTPGIRIVVFGGGLSLTPMPPTASPSRLVPPASDEDFPPPEALFACEVITLANTVHAPALGSRQ